MSRRNWYSLILAGTLALSFPLAHAETALDEAMHLMKIGQPDAAESIYFQYFHKHPESLNAQLGLAEIAMRRRDFKVAETYLMHAWRSHPNSAIAAVTLSRLFTNRVEYFDSIRYPDGIEDLALSKQFLETATKISPEHPAVLTQWGELALLRGDYVEADRYLQKALNKSPAFVPALQALIQFYLMTRDLPQARDTALHALELDPNDPNTLFAVAQLLDKADQPDEAIRYALKSERMDAGKLPARNALLAVQYDKLGQTKKAMTYFLQELHDYPNDAQLWLKVGELHERLGETAASIDARRQAIALQPGILDDMRRQAREAGRSEQIPAALKAWRNILVLQPSTIGTGGTTPEDTARLTSTESEARGAIAGLHLLARFLRPAIVPVGAEDDQKLLLTPNSAPGESASGDEVILNSTKLDLAVNPVDKAEQVKETLQALLKSPNSAIAGEAAFLLEMPEKTRQAFEQVDGLSAEAYTILADRLAFDQEFVFARVFYQRAYDENKEPGLMTAMRRLQAKQTLAANIIQEGNALFALKQYDEALLRYRQARVVDRESGTVYLRLGDVYEKLKKWPEAYQAYQAAVSISPGLKQSKGFSQHFDMLKRKAGTVLVQKAPEPEPQEVKPLEKSAKPKESKKSEKSTEPKPVEQKLAEPKLAEPVPPEDSKPVQKP